MNRLILLSILFFVSCVQSSKEKKDKEHTNSVNLKKPERVKVDTIVLSKPATIADSLSLLIAPSFINSSREVKYIFTGFSRPDKFEHNPDKKDHQLFDTAGYLINTEPSEGNHETYSSLASSLWELNKLEDAKKMFLTIIKSSLPCYEETYQHSSDIPGDTATKIYGYGSFTSNYKNEASLYLAKIYIEQTKFDSALSYVEASVNKYKVVYTCGTGFNWQQDNYRYLYGLCYEGLGNDTALFNLLLPYCFSYEYGTLTRVIKNKYSKEEIKNLLKKAELSITCQINNEPSTAEITTYHSSSKKKNSKTIHFYSGTSTISLFGKTVNLPQPDLKDGERATRKHFVQMFKESGFYLALKS